MSSTFPEFIPKAGACLMSLNAYEGRAPVTWLSRDASEGPADNGWRIMSALDTSEYLGTPGNWRITDFNEACAIEPALIGIYDMPIGSRFTIARDGGRIRIMDDASGREITSEHFYVPPQFRA